MRNIRWLVGIAVALLTTQTLWGETPQKVMLLLTAGATKENAKLLLQGDGDYHLQLPAVPPESKETTGLLLVCDEPVTLKHIQATLQGEDRASFSVLAEAENRYCSGMHYLSVQFAPTQPKLAYHATVLLLVTYQDAARAFHTERIQVRLESTVVVLHRASLPMHYGTVPELAPDPYYQCAEGDDRSTMNALLHNAIPRAPEHKTPDYQTDQETVFSQFNGKIPAFQRNPIRGQPPARCWLQGMASTQRTRVVPLMQRGTLDLYLRLARTPTVLEHAVLPLVLQYPKKPLNLLVHTQFVPGVEAFSGHALLASQLELMYQWTYPRDKKYEDTHVFRRKRILNHLGLKSKK